ncbi:MAG: CidA/LrgA family protein [Comamonas sp.]|nr:CidA/LrgA family protein [Comamonas sp.]
MFLYALLGLLALQWLGEWLVLALHLPLPGALVGALLLLAGLLWLGRLPKTLEQVANALLQNMMLLFIPIIAGVMLHFERIAREWLPFLASAIVGTVVTMLATAWVLRWLLADSNVEADAKDSTPPHAQASQAATLKEKP